MISTKQYPKLAIVIPAYKGAFLKETLESIANQSDKDFNLYIGDDCSPDNLKQIIEPFTSLISINYQYFDENLGGQDLIAHWQRCISLVNNEEWVWLFSDDDVMEASCVENFYKQINSERLSDLYHFNVVRINNIGQVICYEKDYDQHLSGTDFLNKLLNFRITSYVVEYIFNRQRFQELGGFEHFDMAWGSDHATWLKFALNGGISTIPDARVRWRSSGLNITSITNNESISERKRNAELEFYRWMVAYLHKKSLALPFSNFSGVRWILQGFLIHINSFGYQPVKGWIKQFSQISRGKISPTQLYVYLMLFRVNYLYKKQVELAKRKFKAQSTSP